MTSIIMDENRETGLQQSEVEPKWKKKGFSCKMWIDPPGMAWIDQVHDVDELLLPITGLLELELPDQTRRLKIGEEVLIPAGVVHTLRNQGRTTACLLYGLAQTIEA